MVPTGCIKYIRNSLEWRLISLQFKRLMREHLEWGSFKVDVDTIDFGHMVGEVELIEPSGLPMANMAKKRKGKSWKQEMDQDIKAFMQSYPQAFPAERPFGKTECLLPLDQR